MDKVKLLLVVVCLSFVSTGAFATGSKHKGGGDVICYMEKGPKGKPVTKCVPKPKKPPVVAKVPEIDGAGAALAVALLGGIVMIVRERRRPEARSSQPAIECA